MRVLIAANAPFASTGYGVQCKHLCNILKLLGHEVAVYVNYGLAGARLNMDGVTLYPCGRTAEGENPSLIGAHTEDHEADVLINLQDMWSLPENYDAHFREGMTWIGWVPVDHDPPAPGTVHWAKKVDIPISYTRWGRDKLRGEGVKNARYIPLVVDAEVYKPQPKDEARKRLGWPDGFVASIVAMNKATRKAYSEQMQAFASFSCARPELNPFLYVHCDSLRKDGLDLHAMAQSLGIYERVIFVNRYQKLSGLPPSYMADVYSASDVLLAATKSEGFGLPIVEAQACGTPVITTKWTGMPELTLNGISVPVRVHEWTPLSSWWGLPDVEAITEALHVVANGTPDKSQHAREHIIMTYSVSAVTERWHALLGEL
jgi:glycosyltransferase involved in cell wall biosynthesis